MTVLQYQTYVEGIRNNPHSSHNKGISLSTVLMAIGGIIIIHGCVMDTTILTSSGSVHNIGFINEQNKQIQIGGIFFLAGIILYGFEQKKVK